MSTLAIIIIVLILLGGGISFPAYGYNRQWGFAPFGGIVGLLLLLLLLHLLGVF